MKGPAGRRDARPNKLTRVCAHCAHFNGSVDGTAMLRLAPRATMELRVPSETAESARPCGEPPGLSVPDAFASFRNAIFGLLNGGNAEVSRAFHGMRSGKLLGLSHACFCGLR